MSIDKLKENYPVKIQWIHFPLHPETPPEGMSLEELFKGRDMSEARQRLKDLMSEAGLAYGNRSHTYNSRLAQELGKWADTQEYIQQGEQDIHDALYKAYFADNTNISDVEELVRIAESVGLNGERARQVIEQREFQASVDEDWQRSKATGVTGVPTFFSSELAVIGCQPYETLEKFVQHLIQLQESGAETV